MTSAQRPAARRRPLSAEPDWLTLGQAARFLGVAQSTIRKWSDQGRVSAFYTPGGHRRFRRVDLEAFVDRSGPARQRPLGPLVLLVDDDPRVSEYLRINLEFAGYRVREAESGERALAVSEDQPPDLVLLEVAIPGLDGWQLLRQLEGRYGAIPVIMFSGTVDEKAAGVAEQGGRHLVGKPFEPDELLARARQLVPV